MIEENLMTAALRAIANLETVAGPPGPPGEDGGGATIPSTTNLIAGDGTGDGADSGIDPADVIALIAGGGGGGSGDVVGPGSSTNNAITRFVGTTGKIVQNSGITIADGASGSLSGTNSGDQTSVTGNAGSATILQTARNINGVSFNGSANITVPAAGSTLTDTVPVAKGGTGLTGLGSALQVLRTNAGETAMEWATPSGGGGGSGDVVGPASATDNALVRFDATTGKLVQNSGITVADGATGALSGTNTGDQTSVTGNAGTATALQTARTINGVSFNGTANITIPVPTVDSTDTLLVGDGSGNAEATGIEPADVITILNIGSLPDATLPRSSIDHTDVALSTVLSGSTYTLVPGTNYYGAVSLASTKTIAISPTLVISDPPIDITIEITATGTLNIPTAIRETDFGSVSSIVVTATGHYTLTFFKSGDGSLHLIDDLFEQLGTGDLADDSVTYAKIQNVSDTDKLLGRSTAGAGNVEEITCTAAGRALLDDAAASNQRTTLGLGTADNPQFATVELGHASDTTLSRSSAGVLAVEGVVVPTISSANTLTNKRITKRAGTTASSATPSIDSDAYDVYHITALAAAITSLTITGTPTESQSLLVAIKDNGTNRALAFGTGSCAYSSDLPAPTTTATGKWGFYTFLYSTALTKWVMSGKLENVS